MVKEYYSDRDPNRTKSLKDILNIELPTKKFWLGVGAGALLLTLANTFYMVGTSYEAVITRFGREVRVESAGLHAKIPFIESKYKQNVTQVKSLEVGFRTVGEDKNGKSVYEEANNNAAMEEEAKMLTGDLNLIYSTMVVQYKTSNPSDNLWKTLDPRIVLSKVAEAAQRQVIGNSSLDEVLTFGKATIEKGITDKMNELIQDYGLGYTIVSIQLQNPRPTKEVAGSFSEVVSAKEERSKLINEAQTYRNQKVPQAEGQAISMVNEAEGYRAKRTETAKGDVLAFAQVLEEYKKAKDVTRTRMYLETMAQVMPRVDKVYDETSGSSQPGIIKLLNLEKPKYDNAAGGAQK
jgi:membrane protease subunit HflK